MAKGEATGAVQLISYGGEGGGEEAVVVGGLGAGGGGSVVAGGDLPAQMVIETAAGREMVGAGLDLTPEPAKPMRLSQVIRWTGGKTPFVQPQAVTITPSGDVLVLDAGQELVYRCAPEGECLREWLVLGLNQLHIQDLAVSPDGETIYLIDAADHCVYKIALD